ncbi:MAG: PLD nuclease N-terminal domain-containing protein [Corynebacterium sp.]|nr:PLD nuclease N-terminal domain-containing protein [Corynebacterium sp.]
MHAYDNFFSLALLAQLVLFVAFIITWLRSYEPKTPKVLWLLIAIILPIVGPVLYLFTHRTHVKTSSS